MFTAVRESGERVIIDGPCLSACTLVLGVVPKDRICVTPRAVFGFHAAWMPTAYWGPYSVSKAAVELMARIYAAETATTKLRVNIFNPGPIRTRMRATAMPGEDPMTLDTPENCAAKIIDLCLPGYAETGTLYNYRVKKFL